MDHKNIPLCYLHFLPMKHTKMTVSQTTGLGLSFERLMTFRFVLRLGVGDTTARDSAISPLAKMAVRQIQ